MDSRPTLVDLFCGCGGFGLGGEMAGFHTLAAVDVDETLQSAYKNNFPNTAVVNGDLATMSAFDWQCILGKRAVDGVIGGPPCQGYSRIGAGDTKDPRRKLLEHYFRHVNLIKPKFFIMENVEGLLDKKNRTQLDSAISIVDDCYTVLPPTVIDSSEFGAPTKRKRVILVGFDLNRMEAVSLEDLIPNAATTTVADAISDTPDPIPQVKNILSFGYSPYKKNSKLSKYAREMRKHAPKGLGSKEAKDMLQKKQVSGVFDTVHSTKVSARYRNTPQGETDPISRSKKLAWEGLCPTLRAGTGADKGSHQAVRPLHPDYGRVITVREAARLQGFPDWFTFHPTKWHSFRMIGNSVSPVVSKSLLDVMYTKVQSRDVSLSA